MNCIIFFLFSLRIFSFTFLFLQRVLIDPTNISVRRYVLLSLFCSFFLSFVPSSFRKNFIIFQLHEFYLIFFTTKLNGYIDNRLSSNAMKANCPKVNLMFLYYDLIFQLKFVWCVVLQLDNRYLYSITFFFLLLVPISSSSSSFSVIKL